MSDAVNPPAPTEGAGVTEAKPTDAPADPKPQDNLEAAGPGDELYEITVKGQKKKLTRDQILARASKAEAAELAFREASQAIAASNKLLQEFQEDPVAVLVKLGHDPEQFFSQYMAKKAKDAELTPEERERQALESELEQYRAEKKKAEEEKQAEAKRLQDEKTAQHLEETLLAAAKEFKLPQNAATLEQLCDVALEAIEHGYTLTPAQICQEVLERQREHVMARDQKLMASMTPEELLEYVGPERFKQMQAASLKKVPAPGQKAVEKKKTEAEPEKKPPRGYISPAEFLKQFGK